MIRTQSPIATAAPEAAFLRAKSTPGAALRHLQFWLLVFLCCAFPAAIGLSIGPYTGKGPPGTYVEPQPIAAAMHGKFQDRVPQGDPWPVKVVTTTPYRLDPPVKKAAVAATPEKSTLPWSCETIRAAAAMLSQKEMARLARRHRLTDAQIAEARRCLKERT